MSHIIPVSRETADEEALEFAAGILRAGEMVVFPAESLYGIGVDCENERAVRRLYKHKKRELDNPVPVIVADSNMAKQYIPLQPDFVQRIMETFWPGPLTIVFNTEHHGLSAISGGTGTVGIRVPGCLFCREMARAFGRGITATSANYSGESANNNIWRIPDRLRNACSLILHGGELSGGLPSTIVSVAGDEPALLRAGAVPAGEIERAAGVHIIARESDGK